MIRLLLTLVVVIVLAPASSFAELPLNEFWRVGIEPGATCMGEVWQENGHTFAVIGTATGVMIASDTGVVWRSDSIGAVTAVARIDFGLGDGPEVLATTVGAETGILHRFSGVNLATISNSTYGSFAPDWGGAYGDSWDTRRAKYIVCGFSPESERAGDVQLACETVGRSWDMHNWGNYSHTPLGIVKFDFDRDGYNDIVVAGSTQAYYEDSWTFYQIDNTIDLSIFRANSDSVRNFSVGHQYIRDNYSQPGGGHAPPIGFDGMATFTRGDSSLLITSSLDSGEVKIDALTTPSLQVVNRRVFHDRIGIYGALHGADGGFLATFQFDQQHLTWYSIPDFIRVDESSFDFSREVGHSFTDLDADGHEELLTLTPTELIAYSIAPLSVDDSPLPLTPYTLHLSAYPNPFNSSTTISYALPSPGWTTLDVMDVNGRLVTRLSEGWKEAGSYQSVLQTGELPSGTFLVKLKSGGETVSQKVELVK